MSATIQTSILRSWIRIRSDSRSLNKAYFLWIHAQTLATPSPLPRSDSTTVRTHLISQSFAKVQMLFCFQHRANWYSATTTYRLLLRPILIWTTDWERGSIPDSGYEMVNGPSLLGIEVRSSTMGRENRHTDITPSIYKSRRQINLTLTTLDHLVPWTWSNKQGMVAVISHTRWSEAYLISVLCSVKFYCRQ